MKTIEFIPLDAKRYIDEKFDHKELHEKSLNIRICLERIIDIYYDFYGYGLYAFENEKELMGLAGFYNKDNRCFISYIIDKKYRRKAYSFKVCKYLLDFIHRTIEIEDIYAEILSSNIASVKLAEKLGVIIVNKIL